MNESFSKHDSRNRPPPSTGDHHTQSPESRHTNNDLLSLASQILHGVNNLLLIIQFSTEKLLRGLSSGDLNYSTVLDIEDARKQAVDLTRQFRDVLSTEIVKGSVTDLNELVLRWKPLIMGVTHENVILDIDLTPKPAIVMAHEESVELILLHLILSSLASIADGGGWLNIRTALTEDESNTSSEAPVLFPSGFVRLCITDTSCDEDEASERHVHNRLHANGVNQAAIRRSTVETVGQIVTSCGGQISVTASADAGTKVDIVLPKSPAVDIPQAPAFDLPQSASGRETILLVDDNTNVRRFVKFALEAQEYKVLEARDACAAIHMASEHSGSLHLLLTDLQLGGVSGRELADKLRSDYPGLPVIYMSGLASDGLALDARSSFLEKPFKPIELITMVRKILDVCQSENGSQLRPI